MVKQNSPEQNETILQEIIEDIKINDDEWRCIVTMLVETTKNQIIIASKFNEACERGYRKAICAISREKVFETFRASVKSDENTIKTKPKSESTNRISSFGQRIREYAGEILHSQVNDNSALPCCFEAALIKWVIYEARLKQLARTAVEFEEEAERNREFLEMQEPPKSAVLPSKRSSATTKVDVKTTSEPRANSRLRRRDEEWRDIIYVDDAPENEREVQKFTAFAGPNLYILLTGFRDAKLPLELIAIGVPLSFIIRLEHTPVTDEHKESKIKLIDFDNINCFLPSVEPVQSLRRISYDQVRDRIEFWKNFETYYSYDLAICSYCPPFIDDDYSDIYDNISYVLYDLYDIIEDHAAYLQSMQLYELCDPRTQKDRLTKYTDFTSLMPDEYISIPFILEALLQQIEHNLKEEDDCKMKKKLEQMHAENDEDDELLTSSLLTSQQQRSETQPEANAATNSATSISTSATSLSKANSAAFEGLTEKLRVLNLKYELISEPNESSPQSPPEPELILHGDLLHINVCRANDETAKESFNTRSEVRTKPESKFSELENFQVQLIQDPRIYNVWKQNNEAEVENYKMHLAGVFKYCQKEGIGESKTIHLLNITELQKLVKSYFIKSSKNLTRYTRKKSFAKPSGYNKSELNRRMNNFKRNCNQENIKFHTSLHQQKTTLNELIRDSNKEDSKSDCCCLETGEPISKPRMMRYPSLRYVRTPEPLYNELTHNSENSIYKALNYNKCSTPNTNQLLQSFEGCTDLFSLIDLHCSLGLPSVEKQCPVSFEEFEQAELLTPTAFLQIVQDCFQEYEDGGFMAKYFVPTDSILLFFCDKPIQPGEIIEQQITCVIRTDICFRDFCDYIIHEEPEWLQLQHEFRTKNALAGRYRNMLLSNGGKSMENLMFKDEDFILLTSLKAADLLKEKEKQNNNYIKQSKNKLSKANAHKNDPNEFCTSTPIFSTDEMNKHKESLATTAFDFIGYDLGEPRRFQVSNFSWTFEATDGMRVHLTREMWLLGSNKQNTMSLRLVMPEKQNGVLRYHEGHVQNGQLGLFHFTFANGTILAFTKLKNITDDTKTNELLYEIQMSYPSGLIIKPVEYKDAEFPFYILQYYEKKGLHCETIKDENYRKYLHNGDIAKFFTDTSVIILRPNGTIITVPNFGKDGDEKSNSEAEGNENCSLPNTENLEKSSLNAQSACECSYFCSEVPSLHYTVLEPDGRHYEVFDGRIIQEFDRFRTSIAESYSTQERFVRRADGTDMLITSNGNLLVSFPDGTRTLSKCLIEKELVHCDWSEEELEFYFGQKKPKGFVSIVIFTRAEHRNYATVFNEPPGTGVLGISMSKGGPNLRLNTHGFGELSINKKLKLEFDQIRVLLTRRECSCRGCTSSATFHLIDPPEALGESNPLLTFQDSTTCLIVKRDDAGFSKIEPSDILTCNCQGNSVKKPRLRIFALSRNGLAHEYHRQLEWQQHQDKIAEDYRSSLIYSDDNNLTLEELKIAHKEYEIPEATPSKKYRIKLGNADDERMEEPFRKGKQHVRYLIARFFKNIVLSGEKSLMNLQAALVRYWKEIATGIQETKETDKPKTCECEEEIVDQMMDIALGNIKTVDWEIYETGRKHWKKPKEDDEDNANVCSFIFPK